MEVFMLNVLTNIALVLEVISAVLLIAVVLLQSGKEAGLSSTITGTSDSYLSKNKGRSLDAKLATATKWVAAVFVVLTVAVLVLLKLKG
jgi:preprotein translocase subunit SecG